MEFKLDEFGKDLVKWSIEPHGKDYALYSGRSKTLHGARLCNLSDFDSYKIKTISMIESAPLLFRVCEKIVNEGKASSENVLEIIEILENINKGYNAICPFDNKQWIIREWEDGEIDFVLFKNHVSGNTFSFFKYYRIKNENVELITEDFEPDLNVCYSQDCFRAATEQEIRKYLELIAIQ